MAVETDLAGLSKALQPAAVAIGSLPHIFLTEIARAVDEELIRRTPVDTGKARSNWIMSINAPVSDVIEPYAPGVKLGISETSNLIAALNQAAAVLHGHHDSDPIYISNNVDYIGLLNQGSSKQAPALFVEVSILGGINFGLQKIQSLIVKLRL